MLNFDFESPDELFSGMDKLLSRSHELNIKEKKKESKWKIELYKKVAIPKRKLYKEYNYDDYINLLNEITENYYEHLEQYTRIQKSKGMLNLILDHQQFEEKLIHENFRNQFFGNILNQYSGNKTGKIEINGKILNITEEETYIEVDKQTGIDDVLLIDVATLTRFTTLFHKPVRGRMKPIQANLSKVSFYENNTQDLKRKISMTDKYVIETSEVLQQKKEIIEEIDKIISGCIEKKGSTYQFSDGDIEIALSSISNGVKTLLILKEIINANLISSGVLLILDEPENELHPEWQVKYAEILCKLQKYFNCKILISTHSNFFLNALDSYSKYYENERALFQTSINSRGEAKITDNTDNIKGIYEDFAKEAIRLNTLMGELNAKL